MTVSAPTTLPYRVEPLTLALTAIKALGDGHRGEVRDIVIIAACEPLLVISSAGYATTEAMLAEALRKLHAAGGGEAN